MQLIVAISHLPAWVMGRCGCKVYKLYAKGVYGVYETKFAIWYNKSARVSCGKTWECVSLSFRFFTIYLHSIGNEFQLCLWLRVVFENTEMRDVLFLHIGKWLPHNFNNTTSTICAVLPVPTQYRRRTPTSRHNSFETVNNNNNASHENLINNILYTMQIGRCGACARCGGKCEIETIANSLFIITFQPKMSFIANRNGEKRTWPK